MTDIMNEDSKGDKYISIIIPCHNCSDTIVRAWMSLKNQTIGIDRLECIFVDDASTDDGQTWDKLQQIEAQRPESVMIIHLDENLRQGGARNVGISYASGKYLMFLDADDELVEDACRILYETAENKPADIIQFNHLYRLGTQSRVTEESAVKADYVVRTVADRCKFLNSSIVTYGCTNKIYRLDLVIKAEAKFAEHCVYEEPLFVYPCFLYAERISLITEPLYIYYFHENSTVTSTIGKRLLDHPRVQLELLEYCMNHQDLYVENKDSIELYFLWSYYCETISFASQQPDAKLPLDYFTGMQHVCKTVFPDWRKNPLMKRIPQEVHHVLESIDNHFISQRELDGFIHASASLS